MKQGSVEWHAARCGLVTASRFYDVMTTIAKGEAAVRRNYRAELVVERLTGVPTEQYISKAMQDGIDREPAARAYYEAVTGYMVREVGFIKHRTLECGASPDGLVGEPGGLELKCPTHATHFEYLKLGKGECPSEYYWQCMGGMWITGRDWWDFCSFHPDFPEQTRLIRRRIMRNEIAIKKLEEGVIEFIKELERDVKFALEYNEPEIG